MPNVSDKEAMKVCLITDAWLPVWGGGQAHVWELAQRLSRKNCHVTIVVPNLVSENKSAEQPESIDSANISLIRLGPHFEFPNFFGRTIFAIVSTVYVISHRFTVVHSHSYSTCLATILKKIFSPKTKIFFTPHGGGIAILGGGLINYLFLPKFLDFLVRKLIPYDGLIGVLSSDITGFSMAKKKIVIGNGVDVTKFKKGPLVKAEKGFAFLNVGRLVPVKNQENLIRGFAEIIKEFPSARLIIIGDGKLKKYLTELISKLNLTNSVKLLGSLTLDQMPAAYREAGAFVLPSTFEGQPISLLEAMSSHLPVIVSSAGESATIVRSAACGLVLSDTSAQTIGESLKKILRFSKGDLEKMGDQSRLWVTKNASWDEISEKTLNFYLKK